MSGARMLRRYDWASRSYAPYEVPASWRGEKYLQSADTAVNCAGCGKPMRWGDTYTSMEIHDRAGLGYGVCGTCYDKEMKRRRAAGKGMRC